MSQQPSTQEPAQPDASVRRAKRLRELLRVRTAMDELLPLARNEAGQFSDELWSIAEKEFAALVRRKGELIEELS